MDFRSCGDCHACCSGALLGSAYGTSFGMGKKCVFLVKESCTIYDVRPQVCRNFQCAWTQKILPEWMKPNTCGVLVSVEREGNHQFLRATELIPNVGKDVYRELDKFVQENNSYYKVVKYETKLGFGS